MPRFVRRALLVLALLTAATPEVWASGLATPLVGSGFGNATRDDASAVYWNPGNLARLKRPEILGSAAVVFLHIGYERERRATYQHPDGFVFAEPLAPSDVDASKTGRSEAVAANGVLATGSLFGAVPIGDRVAVGLGIYAPYGAIISFDDAGDQRWALQKATILAGYVTPAVSVRATDWLSFGLGVSLVTGALELQKVQDLAGTDLIGDALARPPIEQPNDFGTEAPASIRELDVLSRQVVIRQAQAWSWSFILGATAELSDKVRLGVAYTHSAPMTFKGTFTLDMNDDYFTRDLASQGLQYPAQIRGDAWVSFELPKSLRVAVNWTPTPRWSFTGSVEGVRYSRVKNFDVTLRSPDLAQPALGIGPITRIKLPRDWNDTLQVELTAAFSPNDRSEYGLRVGYHSPFSPDSTTDVSSPDGHRLRVSPMGRMRFGKMVWLGLEGDIQWLIPRTVRSSNYDLANGEYRLRLITVAGTLGIVF
jgi:long-chain fatty acid transport protein